MTIVWENKSNNKSKRRPKKKRKENVCKLFYINDSNKAFELERNWCPSSCSKARNFLKKFCRRFVR